MIKRDNVRKKPMANDTAREPSVKVSWSEKTKSNGESEDLYSFVRAF